MKKIILLVINCLNKQGTKMRIFLILFMLVFSFSADANTYTSCSVDSIANNESVQNISVVTLNCVAPDAATSGSNCIGAPKSNSFLLDISTANGKAELSFLLVALSAGNLINATTYGYCIPAVSDTLALYSLKILKK